MKKRLIALLLGSIMVVGFAVGCGKKDAAEDKSTQTVEETEKSEEEQIAEKTQDEMGYGYEVSYDKDKKEIHVVYGVGFAQNVNEMYNDYSLENREDDFYKMICYNVVVAKETAAETKEYIEKNFKKNMRVVVDYTTGSDIAFSVNDEGTITYDDPLKEIPFDSEKYEGIKGNWYEAKTYWLTEEDLAD